MVNRPNSCIVYGPLARCCRGPPYLTNINSLLAPPAHYILVLADDAALRWRLPYELEQAGFGAYVAHGLSDAADLVRELPPYAVVLDLFHGSEDAWRHIKPLLNDARLVVTGKFTAKSVADRLEADAYLIDGDIPGIVRAILSLSARQLPEQCGQNEALRAISRHCEGGLMSCQELQQIAEMTSSI